MREHETEGAETPPILFEDMDIDDWEVKIYQAVLRREKKGGGRPDPEDTAAMEEPFRQLAGACALFGNFTTNLRPGTISGPWPCSSWPTPSCSTPTASTASITATGQTTIRGPEIR